MLFAVLLRDDTHGLIDLYVSHKQGDGSWGTAVNLGERVNTEHFERFASISRDGQYLFFARCFGDQFPDQHTRFCWIGVEGLAQLRDYQW